VLNRNETQLWMKVLIALATLSALFLLSPAARAQTYYVYFVEGPGNCPNTWQNSQPSEADRQFPQTTCGMRGEKWHPRSLIFEL
jgi:hypothetical protein